MTGFLWFIAGWIAALIVTYAAVRFFDVVRDDEYPDLDSEPHGDC